MCGKKEDQNELNKDKRIEISDEELENVSGGFITIFDTCKKYYDRGTCFRLDGLMICPQLIAEQGEKVSTDGYEGYFVYHMTCKKGLFSGVYEQIEWYSAGGR